MRLDVITLFPDVIRQTLAVGVVGGPQTVRAGLQALVAATQADEFMLVSDVYDPALRLRSLEITAQAHAALSPAAATMAG